VNRVPILVKGRWKQLRKVGGKNRSIVAGPSLNSGSGGPFCLGGHPRRQRPIHTPTLAAVSRPVAHVFHAPDTQRPSDPATQRPREAGRRVHGAPVSCPSNHGAKCAMATAAPVRTRRYMMRPSVARYVVERHHHHDLHRQNHRGLHRQHHQQHQHQHAHTRPQDVRSRLGKDCAWPIPLSVQCPPTAAASLVDHALRCC
jgi:hypothetical protein